jgi:hypothetical protein
MIKILRFLFFTLFGFTSAFSQAVYFKTGKNFTNYVFESSAIGINSFVVKLQPDSGPFYELGLTSSFGSSRFSYEFGISLNELNSIVETPSKAVSYKTEFIGLDNAVLFSVFKTKTILWDGKLGFGLQTMIFGKQEIEGTLYNLKQFDEFNGLFLRQSLGTQVKLVASNQLNFSIGYDYHYSLFKTNNRSNQSLKINNSQIKFGVYYILEKKNKNAPIKDSLKSAGISDSKLLTKEDNDNKSPMNVDKVKNQIENSSSKLSRNGASLPLSNTSNTQSANNTNRVSRNGLPISSSNTPNTVQYNTAPNRLIRNTILSQPLSNVNNNSSNSSSNRLSRTVGNPIQNGNNYINNINANLENDNNKLSSKASNYNNKLQTSSTSGSLENSMEMNSTSPDSVRKEEVLKGNNQKMISPSIGSPINSLKLKATSNASSRNTRANKSSLTGKKNVSKLNSGKNKSALNEISNRLKKVEKKVNIIEKQHGIK